MGVQDSRYWEEGQKLSARKKSMALFDHIFVYFYLFLPNITYFPYILLI